MTSLPENECAECAEFDATTKGLMRQLFSTDELNLLTLLTAASIRIANIQRQKAGRNDIKTAMRCQRDADFAGAMIAKFFVSFDEADREKILAQIRKDHGLAFSMASETCPHKPKPEPTPPACRAV